MPGGLTNRTAGLLISASYIHLHPPPPAPTPTLTPAAVLTLPQALECSCSQPAEGGRRLIGKLPGDSPANTGAHSRL